MAKKRVIPSWKSYFVSFTLFDDNYNVFQFINSSSDFYSNFIANFFRITVSLDLLLLFMYYFVDFKILCAFPFEISVFSFEKAIIRKN